MSKRMGRDKALIPRNGTASVIFWTYNVYYLDREIVNLMPGALNLIQWAVKLKQNPGLIKWKPAEENWTGEPGKKVGAESPLDLSASYSRD